jgi:hypothetical protein
LTATQLLPPFVEHPFHAHAAVFGHLHTDVVARKLFYADTLPSMAKQLHGSFAFDNTFQQDSVITLSQHYPTLDWGAYRRCR